MQKYAANGANPASGNYLYKEFNKHVITYLKGESYEQATGNTSFTQYNYIKDKAPLYTLLIKKSYTKDEFSHVSIALDIQLEKMYSFGRLKPYNPFIAGFVHEYIHTRYF